MHYHLFKYHKPLYFEDQTTIVVEFTGQPLWILMVDAETDITK